MDGIDINMICGALAAGGCAVGWAIGRLSSNARFRRQEARIDRVAASSNDALVADLQRRIRDASELAEKLKALIEKAGEAPTPTATESNRAWLMDVLRFYGTTDCEWQDDDVDVALSGAFEAQLKSTRPASA